jgi:hypothetical protein
LTKKLNDQTILVNYKKGANSNEALAGGNLLVHPYPVHSSGFSTNLIRQDEQASSSARIGGKGAGHFSHPQRMRSGSVRGRPSWYLDI